MSPLDSGVVIPKISLRDTYYNQKVWVSKYAYNGRLAITLGDEAYGVGGPPLTVVTVNLVGHQASEGCVFVKDYAENTGLLVQLSDILTPTGETVVGGYVLFPEAKVTGPLLDFVQSHMGTMW